MKPKKIFVWLNLLGTLIFISLIVFSGFIILKKLSPELLDLASGIVWNHIFHISVIAIVFIFAAAFFFDDMFRRFILPIYKLAEDISIITSANPSRRIYVHGNKHYEMLANAINEWADRWQDMRNSVEDEIARSNEQLEIEKNIFASVISELSEGIIICAAQGNILLFNKRARELLDKGNVSSTDKPLKSPGLIGLGRSIFGVIDKKLIIHAMEEIGEKMRNNARDIASAFVAPGGDKELYRVEALPILKLKNRISGFILVIHDITRQVEKKNLLSSGLRSYRRDIRASLASVRSAMEVILEYPDMEEKKLRNFIDIIKSEFDVINRKLDSETLEYPHVFHDHNRLVPMEAGDLLESANRKIKKKTGMISELKRCEEGCWIQIDTYTMILALLSLMNNLREETGSLKFSWFLRRRGRFVNMDVFWRGTPVSIEQLRKWEYEELSFEGDCISMTLNDVIAYHEGKVWPYSPGPESDKSYLRIVLPLAEVPDRDSRGHQPVFYKSRPEFYDFDLFREPKQTSGFDKSPLAGSNFTVFDTETTGLDPNGGDEIISIGGFRIVNQRILKTEYFDQLIDPRRPIPWESIQIHGIYPEMLDGKPIISKVLPMFRQFVGKTILIAHNAAFDMKMLQMKEVATGIKFTNPTLDTMLLSEVVHPAQDDHTLEAIAERMGVCVVGRHSALGDALATGELFLKMIPLLAEMGIHTLEEALAASKRAHYSGRGK